MAELDYTYTFFKTTPAVLSFTFWWSYGDPSSRITKYRTWIKLGKKFYVARIAGWPGGPIALLVMVALLPKPDAARINTVRQLTSDLAKIWRQKKQHYQMQNVVTTSQLWRIVNHWYNQSPNRETNSFNGVFCLQSRIGATRWLHLVMLMIEFWWLQQVWLGLILWTVHKDRRTKTKTSR